jgi:pimeloyl-ACP methyl ester carboxylesterase
VGAYRLADGRALDLAPAGDSSLRWRLEDGASAKLTRDAHGNWTGTWGWTDRSDSHRFTAGPCESGEIALNDVKGERIPLEFTDTSFRSGDAELAGRLILPPGDERVPVVVLVHGSEDTSAREFFSLQRQLPAAGIGTFVYDKRGTGGSTGTFTHDYHQLARDVVAAVKEARRLAGKRASRLGLQGSSQGGWVSPLAATLTHVDFVVVAYGLAVSPIQEDREAVAWDMARAGFGVGETRDALEVAGAVQAIIESNFSRGYTELENLRSRYSRQPWFRYLRGNVTGLLLAHPESFWREKGPVLLAGIDPHYDPMPVLAKLHTPQLWILGADDIDAPPQETWRRLLKLQQAGRPLSLAMLRGAEHGLFLYELNGKGERESTRLAPAFFPLMRDFLLEGKIGPNYPDAVIVR